MRGYLPLHHAGHRQTITMSTLYTCLDCKTPVELVPPLSQRTSGFGQPMTRAEALSIFRDGTGGRCTDCYLKQQREQVEDLMRRQTSGFGRVKIGEKAA